MKTEQMKLVEEAAKRKALLDLVDAYRDEKPEPMIRQLPFLLMRDAVDYLREENKKLAQELLDLRAKYEKESP